MVSKVPLNTKDRQTHRQHLELSKEYSDHSTVSGWVEKGRWRMSWATCVCLATTWPRGPTRALIEATASQSPLLQEIPVFLTLVVTSPRVHMVQKLIPLK